MDDSPPTSPVNNIPSPTSVASEVDACPKPLPRPRPLRLPKKTATPAPASKTTNPKAASSHILPPNAPKTHKEACDDNDALGMSKRLDELWKIRRTFPTPSAEPERYDRPDYWINKCNFLPPFLPCKTKVKEENETEESSGRSSDDNAAMSYGAVEPMSKKIECETAFYI